MPIVFGDTQKDYRSQITNASNDQTHENYKYQKFTHPTKHRTRSNDRCLGTFIIMVR